MKSLRRVSLTSLLVLFAAFSGVQVSSHGLPHDRLPVPPGRPSHEKPKLRPAIVEYHLVKIERHKRAADLELVYRATLKNGDEPLSGATAKGVSVHPRLTVVDGTLTFGPVRPRGHVISRDTFTVRYKHGHVFHPKWPPMEWTITPNGSAPPVNRPPAANAGPDQSVSNVGVAVQLNGALSSDPDGNPLSYSWTLIRPAGSAATLSSPTAVNPTFTPDRRGAYEARLVVNDGALSSAPDSAIVTVSNTAPVANAGADFSATVTQTAALKGDASSDADGDALTYAWSFVSRPTGSAATLSDSAAANPTFLVDRPGTYTVRLVVNDGTANSAPDTVTVTTINRAPAADAGPDQTAQVGALVTLNGSGSSDPDGNALTYAWAFQSRPAGSLAALSGPTSVGPTFTIDRPGTYVVRLVVNDGSVSSAPDTVVVSTVNSAPVANAGPDQSALVTQIVTLNGSGSSDVDGDALTFSWAFVGRPAGSSATLSSGTAVGPTFVVDRPGTYRLRLIVNDGSVNSPQDLVDITTQDSAPVANAGADQSAVVTETVTLDGSGSTDVDGDSLSYVWSLTNRPAGSSAVLANQTTVTPSFVVDRPGSYVAQLIVNDGFGPSLADTVTVTTRNSAPVANAGLDRSVVAGQAVMLDGIASSDVDGDVLTFDWSFTARPAGSSATLANGTTSAPSFTADRPGTYVVQLIVHDGTVNSAPDTVTISTSNTTPVANAGPDQLGALVGSISLDGSASLDADGHPLTYQWSLLSVPAGSSASLSGASTASPTFNADRPGDYVAQLIVNDGFVDSVPNTVLVRVVNRAPTADAGSDQSVVTGVTVALNGGNSSDPDSLPLAYQWVLTVPAGSAAALTGSTTATPSFVADVAGTYTVDLTVTDVGGATATDSVAVIAVAPPTVTLSVADGSAAEAGLNTGAVTFTRVGDTSAPLTVDYTVGGSASSGDYAALSGSVTIPGGQASVMLVITPVDDADFEAPETVVVTVAANAAYVVGVPSQAAVTIADNDLPVVTIEATDANASEAGPDQGLFTIFRTGDTSAPLTIQFRIFGSTPGAEFVPFGNNVTIPAGQSSATLVVTPIADGIPEGNENVDVYVDDDPSYVVGDPRLGRVVIAANSN